MQTPTRTNESRCRQYLAAHEGLLTILGPRRIPAVLPASHATDATIPICTSVGFRQVEVKDYHGAINILRPDVAISAADIIMSSSSSTKRKAKSVERTFTWLDELSGAEWLRQTSDRQTAVFATIPSVENCQLSMDSFDLVGENSILFSGLAMHAPMLIPNLPTSLSGFPRICLSHPMSPHDILDNVLLGTDLMTIPFVNLSSDQGIALDFNLFTSAKESDLPLPLGHDIWSLDHQISLHPLSFKCDCYTCMNHHKAYLSHLLQAKEMLAWTLLQIHNYAIVARFFRDIRITLANGTIEAQSAIFRKSYMQHLPVATGTGPRIRGYQVKSTGGGEAKINEKVWGKFDNASAKSAESQGEPLSPS